MRSTNTAADADDANADSHSRVRSECVCSEEAPSDEGSETGEQVPVLVAQEIVRGPGPYPVPGTGVR